MLLWFYTSIFSNLSFHHNLWPALQSIKYVQFQVLSTLSKSVCPDVSNSPLSFCIISFNKHTQCDNHSEAELINSTKHWMDHGINNVKAGPVAAGRAVRPVDHTAIQGKPREVFFSTEG